MSGHYHGVVYIDHREARIFRFNTEEFDRVIVKPSDPHAHLHHKAGSIGSGHANDDHAYFHAVAQEIAAVPAVLIVGPSTAKTQLFKHITRHDPKLVDHVAGIETVDHPTDGALVAHARHYFKIADRMTPTKT